MSGIKALDKLREKIRLDVNNPWSDLQGDLLAMCDKLEREIAERFIELPLDADGVPIHVGDKLIFTDHSGREFDVTVEPLTSWDPSMYRHVEPRTVEDVLRDLVDGIGSVDFDALTAIDGAAAEIRGLLEVDA